MSIESLPKTLSGSARIRNLTHYNIDDLIALIHKVELTFPDKVVWSQSVKENSVGGLDKVFEFREFTGRPKDTAPYGKKEKVRTFVMMRRWRTPLTFRMLPPDKLYISPLESICVAGEDGCEVIPKYMAAQLAESISGCYYRNYKHSRTDNWVELVADMQIRIDKKRKPGSKKHASLARKRELLHKNYRSANYNLAKLEAASDILKEAFAAMERYAKSMGMDMSGINDMMESLEATKESLHNLRLSAEKYAVQAQQLVDEAG